MMTGDYTELMELWQAFEKGTEDHPCNLTDCRVCERSWEARTELVGQLGDIMQLLGRYHDVLADLADQVIQEVPLPRNEKLQLAMLKAVSILDQDGRTHGTH